MAAGKPPRAPATSPCFFNSTPSLTAAIGAGIGVPRVDHLLVGRLEHPPQSSRLSSSIPRLIFGLRRRLGVSGIDGLLAGRLSTAKSLCIT